MKQKIVATLPLIGALAFSVHAHATTENWSLAGGDVSASGTITFVPDLMANSAFGTSQNLVPAGPGYVGVADPLNASVVQNVTGFFTDTALNITNVAIEGIYANNYAPHFAPDPGIPYSFSYYTPTDPTVSYDNLFYADGSSPQTCTLPSSPPALPPGNYGGYFDNYGVMLKLANDDYVDLYSNGDIQATQAGAVPVTLPPYGVVVVTSLGADYENAQGLAFSTPEPSTWAMMALGFASVGFAGYRRSRARLSPAA